MSEGLKALLEAAQFIEQQEKLKLSPQATAIPAILNEQQQRFIMHAYDATIAAAAAAASANMTNTITTTTTTNGLLNGGSINIRNSNMRHANNSSLQVSSSAPAAPATFQHVNGHHLHHHNNNSSSSSNTTASPLQPASSHATTKVLTNGTNNASASSSTTPTTTTATTNGHHQQHLHHSLHHPHLNLNHPQKNSQLLNANNHDYEFNENGSGSGGGGGATTVVATSPSYTGATSANLLQQSSLSGRSNEGRITDDANSDKKNNDTTSNTSFMLLTNSTTTKLLKTSSSSSPIPMDTDESPNDDDDVYVKKSESCVGKTSTNGGSTATFTLIGRNGEIIGNAAASKQILLANGIRIAAPKTAVSIGQIQQQPQQVTLSAKTINIPFNNKNIPIITGFPYQLTSSVTPLSSQQQQSPNNGGGSGVGGGGVGGSSGSSSVVLTGRHKTFMPLTPPPMSSRKFVEPTQSRIRSFSLSSHKFSANNQHPLHVQNGNNGNNNNNSMMVDEIPPTQQQQHHSPSSQHSPPRHVSSSLGATAGSHYMHMINAASSQQSGLVGSGANHITHATPRRRTISSTSNGAGTREVHNKLEKNRRAHLKECYEALKNQLSLKDEDRRKTSNLAILGEALKCVQSFQYRNQELEAEWEHLANDKINLQKRIVSLKRELGPKYEQIFSGIFPEIEIGSIPSERETINETHSLSSGRGSTLYSSSSSLSSGGSNGSSSSSGGSGSNTMSSPVGAGLQTAMPTTISPVINKINNNINSTSPISINNNNSNVVSQQQHQRKTPSITTTIQAVAIPAQGGGGGISSPTAGSPTALVTFGSSLPLSLTAKNISATAVTRGSPTPSTPSPSPSSSSGVSSSSSLISSSPPINGVISNGRNVTVNIPNGLKLQAAAATGAGLNGGGNGSTSTSTAATILSTSAPAQGVNNTNNVLENLPPQQQHNGRKKNLTLSNSSNNNNNNNNVVESKNNHQYQQQQQQHASEDGEQPAKFLKVFNSSSTSTNGHHHDVKTVGQKFLVTSSNGGILQSGGCGGNNNHANNNNNNNIGSSLTAAAAAINKSVTNGSASYAVTPATLTTTNELCRLPGGAELNILPSNGLKISSGGVGPLATAFYHANGKITIVNGPPAHHHPHQYQYHQHPPSSSPLPNSTTITSNGTTTLTNGILLKDATSVTPLLVSAASSLPTSSVNGLHFAGNFAQLLASANSTAIANNTGHSNNGMVNAAAATASIVPMATNYQNIVESKMKNNNKNPIITWRSGAAAN